MVLPNERQDRSKRFLVVLGKVNVIQRTPQLRLVFHGSRLRQRSCGGDALDLSCVSHWNANLPGNKRKGELKSDLDGFDKEILRPIEALLPRGCEKVFLTGNHERFLDRKSV